MTQRNPPKILYHGTSINYLPSIKKKGIVPINHEHVYLTPDIEYAYEYAKKFNYPVLCVIDATAMYIKGFDFYDVDEKHEWVVSNVPAEYIIYILVEHDNELGDIKDYAQRVILD